MVRLLSEDVPSLHDWGTRFIIDVLTGFKTITATRSEWVANEASTLIRAILPMRSLAFASTITNGRSPGALNVQRAGPLNTARPSQPSSHRPPFQVKRDPKDGYKSKPKGDDAARFGLCGFCDARGCQNADNPKAGIATCSVFAGCACKPNASPDEKQYVEIQRKFLKEAGPKSKYHTSPYLKGAASRSDVWQFTKDLAERSMVTNLPTSGVRIRRENRLRQVGKFRTMAAQLVDEGDNESAAYLYRCADRVEQDDSDDEVRDEASDDGAVHNLAAENELVGAFNRLAQVDDFDKGAFVGAEGLFTDADDGSLNVMQNVGRLNALSQDRVVDLADAYIQGVITPVYVEVPIAVYAEKLGFDLNASDASDDESPTKLQRFDLNASDCSDNDFADVGRLSMLQGSYSRQDEDSLDTSDAAAVSNAAGIAAAKVWEAAKANTKAAKAAAARNAEAFRAHAAYGAHTTTSLPQGIFVASADMVLCSNQRFVFAVTPSLVNSGVAPRSNLGTVFETKAIRRHSLQAQVPPGWRATEHTSADQQPWFLSETALFNVPTSELWRAVVFESELSPGYIPAVGMYAFQDVDCLSAEATAAHMHDRARLAELFMQGSAHHLLLHRKVSDANQSTEEAPLPSAQPYVSDLERRKTRERQARLTTRAERVRSYRAVDVLDHAARFERLDHGSLNMLRGADVPGMPRNPAPPAEMSTVIEPTLSCLRFILAVTDSLVRTGAATIDQRGYVFHMTAVLRDDIHAQLEHIVAGSTQPYLLVVPQSELWRAVILEDELPAGFIPTVGTNITSWIGCFHREKTRARMTLRQQLAEALIRDNANILGQPDRLGRLIMLSGTPEFSHPDESNGTFTFASSVDPGPLRNDDPHGRFGTRPAVDSVVAKAFSLRNRASSTKRYPMPRQLPIGATQPLPRRL